MTVPLEEYDHEPVEEENEEIMPTTSICAEIDWPAEHLWMTHRARPGGPAGSYSWWGSLIHNKRDLTGQLYMRNRYYDPAAGRFTQEDPIGLAGGVNLYGFAAGDPVSYSDPYGLSAEASCPPCAVAYALFEAGATLYDVADLGVTTYQYARGQASKAQLGATATGVVVGMWMFGGGYGRLAREGADLTVRGVTNLTEQMAVQELADGVRAGAGVVLAGGSHRVPFRAAQGFAAQYGGAPADWVKKSTTRSVRGSDGYTYQIHWAENVKTGQIVDAKITVNAPK